MEKAMCKKCGRPKQQHLSAVGPADKGGKGLNYSVRKGCSEKYK